MNSQFWDDLRLCFDRAARDNTVRCVVLSANGRAFSAGLDLQDAILSPTAGNNEKLDPARKSLRFIQSTKRLQDSLSSLEKCWKPVVAAVHGACIGGGIDLICAADIRFCSSDVKFCIKEAAIGIAADLGTLQRLPKIVGNHSVVRELALTARNMDAKEAKELGLVSKVLPSREELIQHACHTAGLIAEHSPVAIASTKANLNYCKLFLHFRSIFLTIPF
jgi:Delta3,5-Delta2,4-dienoyl-CoA isomerase